MRQFLTLFALWIPFVVFSANVTTDKFYINDFSISPGEQKELELNLHSTQDYYSIQVNIYLPAGLSFVFNEDEEDYIVPTDRIPDVRKNGWPYLGDFVVGGDGSLLITAYSPNLVLALEADDGPVFTFVVEADDNFEGGLVECKFSEMTDMEYEAHNGPDTQCLASKPVSLADIVSEGKVDGVYAINEALTCVYINDDGTMLLAKDDNGFAQKSQPPYVPTGSQEDFDDPSNFDQSNWVEIALVEPVTASEKASLLGHIITGVKGTLLNVQNPKLTVKEHPVGGITKEYTPNSYNPANFVAQETFFLMPPKPQEYAKIKWGVYQDGVLYVPQKDGTNNPLDLSGAVSVNTELYKGDALVNGTVYEMIAVIKVIETPKPSPKRVEPKTTEPSNLFEIYPVTATTSDIITGVESIDAHMANDELYYNLLGQPTKNPAPGIYIHCGKKVVVY